jgi:hypothetical protein
MPKGQVFFCETSIGFLHNPSKLLPEQILFDFLQKHNPQNPKKHAFNAQLTRLSAINA